MFDTPITLVGNVLTAPQWRRTTTTGTFVVTFRVASTSRRFDRARDTWVDGDSLRVRVTCWRRLGENVSVSVQLGDPVVVVGRMYTRDWTDEQGTRHTSYEVDAVAVGHDLSRGVSRFARRRPPAGADTVESAASAARVGGEMSVPVAGPGRPDDLPPDHELFEGFDPLLYDTTGHPPLADTVLESPPAAANQDDEDDDLDEDDDQAEDGDGADGDNADGDSADDGDGPGGADLTGPGNGSPVGTRLAQRVVGQATARSRSGRGRGGPRPTPVPA